MREYCIEKNKNIHFDENEIKRKKLYENEEKTKIILNSKKKS